MMGQPSHNLAILGDTEDVYIVCYYYPIYIIQLYILHVGKYMKYKLMNINIVHYADFTVLVQRCI